MPRVTIDLSEAQSRKPVPDDQYLCTVKEIQGPTKGPKSLYLTFVLEIKEGEYAGRRFYYNTPISGEGAGIFTTFLSKLTGQEIDVDELDKIDINTDDLLGLDIGVVTKTSEYPEGSGEFRSEIKTILRAA